MTPGQYKYYVEQRKKWARIRTAEEDLLLYKNNFNLVSKSQYSCASDNKANMKLVCEDVHPKGMKVTNQWTIQDICNMKAHSIPQFKTANIVPRSDNWAEYSHYYQADFPNCRMAVAKHYVEQFPDTFQVIAQQGDCANTDKQNANLLCVIQSTCAKTGRGCVGDGACFNGNKEYPTFVAALEQCNKMSDCEGMMQSENSRQWVLRSGSDPPTTADVAQYCPKSLDNETIEYACAYKAEQTPQFSGASFKQQSENQYTWSYQLHKPYCYADVDNLVQIHPPYFGGCNSDNKSLKQWKCTYPTDKIFGHNVSAFCNHVRPEGVPEFNDSGIATQVFDQSCLNQRYPNNYNHAMSYGCVDGKIQNTITCTDWNDLPEHQYNSDISLAVKACNVSLQHNPPQDVAIPSGTYYKQDGSQITANWLVSSDTCYYDIKKESERRCDPDSLQPKYVMTCNNWPTWKTSSEAIVDCNSKFATEYVAKNRVPDGLCAAWQITDATKCLEKFKQTSHKFINNGYWQGEITIAMDNDGCGASKHPYNYTITDNGYMCQVVKRPAPLGNPKSLTPPSTPTASVAPVTAPVAPAPDPAPAHPVAYREIECTHWPMNTAISQMVVDSCQYNFENARETNLKGVTIPPRVKMMRFNDGGTNRVLARWKVSDDGCEAIKNPNHFQIVDHGLQCINGAEYMYHKLSCDAWSSLGLTGADNTDACNYNLGKLQAVGKYPTESDDLPVNFDTAHTMLTVRSNVRLSDTLVPRCNVKLPSGCKAAPGAGATFDKTGEADWQRAFPIKPPTGHCMVRFTTEPPESRCKPRGTAWFPDDHEGGTLGGPATTVTCDTRKKDWVEYCGFKSNDAVKVALSTTNNAVQPDNIPTADEAACNAAYYNAQCNVTDAEVFWKVPPLASSAPVPAFTPAAPTPVAPTPTARLST